MQKAWDEIIASVVQADLFLSRAKSQPEQARLRSVFAVHSGY